MVHLRSEVSPLLGIVQAQRPASLGCTHSNLSSSSSAMIRCVTSAYELRSWSFMSFTAE